MAEPVSIVLVGLGGYGEVYLADLLNERADVPCRLVATVDPTPQNCSRLDELRARGLPIHASLEDFCQTDRADLAVISSPIHRHCAQTCLALSQGSYVLCEKPPAATVQEVDRMIEARDQAGKWVAIGYQWSFSAPIQQLKQDIRAGLLGRPRRLKSLCVWPRGQDYYRRNDWAGRLRSDDGAWILDSPLNNAMAHDLHNMLYILGDEADTSAQPTDVVAELYRANDIENHDTAALRVHTDVGAEILFYGSHAIVDDAGPIFSFEFERGTVEVAGGQLDIVARLAGGAVKRYASPESAPQLAKLWNCASAIAEGHAVPCGLEAARPHTVCTNGAQDSVGVPVAFPQSLLRVEERPTARLTWVAGLAQVLRHCFAGAVLPSEAAVPWARAGQTINLRGYCHFPSGSP